MDEQVQANALFWAIVTCFSLTTCFAYRYARRHYVTRRKPLVLVVESPKCVGAESKAESVSARLLQLTQGRLGEWSVEFRPTSLDNTTLKETPADAVVLSTTLDEDPQRVVALADQLRVCVFVCGESASTPEHDNIVWKQHVDTKLTAALTEWLRVRERNTAGLVYETGRARHVVEV